MYDLKIRDFILSHPDWEELLQQKPYCLKISRDDGYIMFKYSQIESDFNEEIVREARGIIFRESNWDCVCHAFNKFGNYGENYVPDMDWNSVAVTEKKDGSLIKWWWDNGSWHISTNGTIDAAKANLNDAKFETFMDLIEHTLDEKATRNGFTFWDINDMFNQNRHCTLMFELVTPYNRVVVPTDKCDIFYLGARNMVTGEEFPMWDNPFKEYIDSPRIFDMKNLEDVKAAANALPWDEEGYVCVDKNFNRCKIKSPAYVLAHHARSNGVITNKRLIEVILRNEIKEFCIYCSEYTDKIIEIQMRMAEKDYEAHSAVCRYCGMNTKKEMALAMNEDNIPDWVQGFCFRNFDKETSWKDYTGIWSLEKWEKVLEV